MEYYDIQKIENKIVRTVYDTAKVLDSPKSFIPNKMVDKHKRHGRSTYNPNLYTLYTHRITKLIVEYVKTVILYAYDHNLVDFILDVTLPFSEHGKIAHKLIEIEDAEANIKPFWRKEVPLISIDSGKHTINLEWISYSSVGTKFSNDFTRKSTDIMKKVYNELSNNSELLCWLTLASMGDIFYL